MQIADLDPDWAYLNWQREKAIMLNEGKLDRKSKEIIAMVVSILSNCQYCHLAHKSMALMSGATQVELYEVTNGHALFGHNET